VPAGAKVSVLRRLPSSKGRPPSRPLSQQRRRFCREILRTEAEPLCEIVLRPHFAEFIADADTGEFTRVSSFEQGFRPGLVAGYSLLGAGCYWFLLSIEGNIRYTGKSYIDIRFNPAAFKHGISCISCDALQEYFFSLTGKFRRNVWRE
jgi:hypothetical protein